MNQVHILTSCIPGSVFVLIEGTYVPENTDCPDGIVRFPVVLPAKKLPMSSDAPSPEDTYADICPDQAFPGLTGNGESGVSTILLLSLMPTSDGKVQHDMRL